MNIARSNVNAKVGTLFKLCAPLVMVTLLLQVWLFHPLVAEYYPTLDEIAMQAASTNIGGAVHPSLWFTQGLHGYFVPYPEWNVSATDYWRPLVNCWYWLNQQLSGDHWANQLIFGYLAHSLVVGLTCYFAASVLGLNPVMLSAAVLIAMFNPSYVFHSVNDPFSIPRATQFPIYQIEVIDALLMMVAMLAFLRRRYWEFSLIATAAVLFKETALALPVSAALLVLVWSHGDKRRSSANFAWLGLPLAIWSAGRLVAYFHGAIQVLPAGASTAWLTRPLRNFLLWPTGLYQESLGAARAAVSMHDWPAVLRYAAELLVDLTWWAALAAAMVAGYKLWVRRGPSAGPEPWFVVLVFALGNLLWVMLLPASELRYGYLWFAVGPAAIFAVLSRYRLGSAAAVGLTLCLVVPQLNSLAQALSAQPLEAYRIAKQSARQLTSEFGQLPPQVKTVYLVDDIAVQTSSPQYFATFAQFSRAIVLVNNLAPIRGCSASASASATQRYRLTREGSVTNFEYQAPECFQRAWNVAPLDQFDSGKFIQRGKWMTYHFPDLTGGNRSFSGNRFDYEPGRRWTLRVTDPKCEQPGACAWLGFAPAERRYYALTD